MSDLIEDVVPDGLAPVAGLAAREVRLPSSADGHEQPVLIGVPETGEAPRPLLVGLHTWSADYRQQWAAMGPVAAARGWLLVLPNFRGPNLVTNPAAREAGGSLLAQRDVMDAVRFMQREYAVDAARIYLLGGSGGGHMALMMAGKYPEVWAGVSAWCPVSDLRAWHSQRNGYAPHIEAVCGGAPGDSAGVDFEYLVRSPRTFITNLANARVNIRHGDQDPIIWVRQTWETYERLRGLPHRVEFGSWSGGHDMLLEAGAQWLAEQLRPSGPPIRQRIVTDEAKWYYWLYVEPAGPLTLGHCDAEYHPALPATADAPPQAARLRLQVEGCREVRVRGGDLGLGAPASVLRAGVAAAAAEVRTADGYLFLTPETSAPAEYWVEF